LRSISKAPGRRIARNELGRDRPISLWEESYDETLFRLFSKCTRRLFETGPAARLRARRALRAAAPARAQTFVGNNFSPGSSLLSALETIGFKDSVPPFVILQEYDPSGPATTGAIFGSAGTVNDVTFYGGGNYDFTVYALALTGSNPAQNELTFNVVGDQTFASDATTKGMQNLAANFPVGAGDYLAFACHADRGRCRRSRSGRRGCRP
jgi:hypothetical protein